MKILRKRLKIDTDVALIQAIILKNKKNKNSFLIKKGLYKINLKVKNCYIEGGSENYDFLDVPTDMYLNIDGGSDKIYKASKLHKKGCQLSTGGDGSFTVILELTKIKKIPYNPIKLKIQKTKEFLKNKKLSDVDISNYYEKNLNSIYISEIENIFSKYRSMQTKKRLKEINKSFLKLDKLLLNKK